MMLSRNIILAVAMVAGASASNASPAEHVVATFARTDIPRSKIVAGARCFIVSKASAWPGRPALAH